MRGPERTRETTLNPLPGTSRTELKRLAIVDAATRLFLKQGYQGTSMDEIAAAAGVSKQTVYKQFQDKEQLFTGIVLGITDRAQQIVETIEKHFDEILDVQEGLTRLAHFYAASVVSPQVVQLRRLVIGESDHFPELAEAYFDRAPKRGLDAIATGLGRLVERDLLRIDDVETAAVQFAYLVLGPLIDLALFRPRSPVPQEEIKRYAAAGARLFVAVYS